MKRSHGGHPNKSSNPPPLPKQGIDHRRQFGGGRDSDASFASSRPSSIGTGRSAVNDLVRERSYQLAALREINSFLAAHSLAPIKSKVPSAKEITTAIFNFILSKLEISDPKMEQDLPIVLESFNCPFKVKKSTLCNPSIAPLDWPTLVAVLHWLVQIANCNDRPVSSSSEETMHKSLVERYLFFIQGYDDSVEALERDFEAGLNEEKARAAAKAMEQERIAAELEAKVEALRTGPSERELLENGKSVLEEKVKKYQETIEDLTKGAKGTEKKVDEKKKKLIAKADEKEKICEENEELKKTLQLQTVNPRAVERMKKEQQALEREIADSETERNNFEDKCWDLDSERSHKLKELEELALECNKAIRKLKLGSDFQYVLNIKGRTPAEVLGIDYKSEIKPALDSYADDIQKSSMVKSEELIPLQQLSAELSTKIYEKQNRIPSRHSRTEELENEINLVEAETNEHVHRCALEAEQMVDDIQEDTRNVALLEEEAAGMLKASEVKLQETVKEEDEEIKECGAELAKAIDSMSKYKEFMQGKVSEMMGAGSDTAKAMADARMKSTRKIKQLNQNQPQGCLLDFLVPTDEKIKQIDAAEMIEEAESVEQKAYRERVESLRKKRMELKAPRLSAAKRKRSSREEDDDNNKDKSSEESSDDDDAVGNFAVDWRAQHI